MKKKLYYLLLMALLASCGSKENTEDPIDPNSPNQKILGDWRQYQSVQYRESFEPSINKYSPPLLSVQEGTAHSWFRERWSCGFSRLW